MPRFREGNAHCSVENSRKTDFLGKTLLNEQSHPTQGPAADPLLQMGLKGSRAVVKHPSTRTRQEHTGLQHHKGVHCPDRTPIACRSSHQEGTLQADSCSSGSTCNLRDNSRGPWDLLIDRKQPLLQAKRAIDGLAGEAVKVYQLSGDYYTGNNPPTFPHRLFCKSLHTHTPKKWFM